MGSKSYVSYTDREICKQCRTVRLRITKRDPLTETYTITGVCNLSSLRSQSFSGIRRADPPTHAVSWSQGEPSPVRYEQHFQAPINWAFGSSQHQEKRPIGAP